MVDRNLTEVYEGESKTINQAVKGNINRFPVQILFSINQK
jgi:hypothetical protein